MIPSDVVRTMWPKEREGSRLLIHFSSSGTVTSNRGLITPHLLMRPMSCGEGAGSAGRAWTTGVRARRRARVDDGGARKAPRARAQARRGAPPPRLTHVHDNLAGAVVVHQLKLANVVCKKRARGSAGARGGGGRVEAAVARGWRAQDSVPAAARHDAPSNAATLCAPA